MKIFWCLLAVLLLAKPAAAISYEEQVSVSVEAEDQAKAKDLALKQAYRQGFLQVAQRVADPAQMPALEALDDDQLAHFIRETAVISEHGSGKSYRADLKITVNEPLLQQFLAENKTSATNSTANEVLILPIMQGLPIEAENPWRTAWLDKGFIASQDVIFKVFNDTLPSDKLDYQELRKQSHIAAIYAVWFVPQDQNHTEIVMQSLAKGDIQSFPVQLWQGNLYDRAVTEVVNRISAERARPSAYAAADDGKLTAVFYYTRLKEWLDTERKLKQIDQIKTVETGALGGGKVQIALEYTGTMDSLRQTLQKSDLTLDFSDGLYILR